MESAAQTTPNPAHRRLRISYGRRLLKQPYLRGNGLGEVMLFTLCQVNEIKLLASLSFFAVAFLTGPATGVTLGWAHGWVVRLTGLTIGSAVGVLAVVVLTNMLDTGGAVPVPGEPNRFTFTCGWDMSGNVTVVWTLLYVVQVAAIVLTTRFATTSLWSLGLIVMGSAIRFRRNLRERSVGRD